MLAKLRGPGSASTDGSVFTIEAIVCLYECFGGEL